MAEIESLIVELDAKVGNYVTNMKKADSVTKQTTDKMIKQFDKTEKEIKQTTVASKNLSLGTIALSGSVALAIRAFTRYADEYTNIQNKLRIVTDGTQELEEATERLLNIANESRSSFESTATLYSRLSQATKELALTDEELFDITETINKSFAVSGATAQEAAAAITQLSQGLASGVLRGDEFNSVAEQAPVILDAVAASTGKARGELREMAADGQITSAVLIKALQDYESHINTDFSKAQVTLGQSFEIANNNITIFVGELDKIFGISTQAAQGIVNVSDELPGLIEKLKLARDALEVTGTTDFLGETVQTLENAFDEISSFFLFLPRLFGDALKEGFELAGGNEEVEKIGEAIDKLRADQAEKGAVIPIPEPEDLSGTTIRGDRGFADKELEAIEIRQQAFADEQKTAIQLLTERLARETSLIETFVEDEFERTEARIELADEFNSRKMALDEEAANNAIELAENEAQAKKDAFQSSANFIAGTANDLQKSNLISAKSAFNVNKIAGVTNAVISTQIAAAKALELGPIAGPPAAVAMAALGAVRVAAIASRSFSGGAGGGGGGGGAVSTGGGAEAPATATIATTSTVQTPEGVSSAPINIQLSAANGDTLGQAIAEFINDGVRNGQIDQVV